MGKGTEGDRKGKGKRKGKRKGEGKGKTLNPLRNSSKKKVDT